MTLTQINSGALAGQGFRRKSGQANDLLDAEVGGGKAVHFDPAGSVTTVSGVATVDLTGTFSVIDAVFYTNLDDANITFVDDPAGDATAGQLKVKLFDADAVDTAVADATYNVAYLVIGDAA